MARIIRPVRIQPDTRRQTQPGIVVEKPKPPQPKEQGSGSK